jgi:hypothetical protein
MLVRIVLFSLSAILMAAHLAKLGLTPVFSGLVLLLPFLFFVKKPFVPKLLQTLCYIGAAEWIRAMFIYIGQREQTGESWTVLAVIMTSVAMFTALSGFLLRSSKIRSRY